MDIPNQIKKTIDEYNAQNPPEVVAEKANLKQKVEAVLEKLNTRVDPVFKEFSDNPLTQKPYQDLVNDVNKFAQISNNNPSVVEPAKMLIVNLTHYFINLSFCDIENCLKNEEVVFENTYMYDFMLTDIVDNVYSIKKQMDISVKDLLTYSYYLAFKDYLVTMVLPMFKYIASHKPKMHLFSSDKNDPAYLICETEKKFIMQNDLLSRQYKYFLYNYKIASRSSKFSVAQN